MKTQKRFVFPNFGISKEIIHLANLYGNAKLKDILHLKGSSREVAQE